MTKQELIQAVKEIREICHNAGETNTWDDCKNCPFYADLCMMKAIKTDGIVALIEIDEERGEDEE